MADDPRSYTPRAPGRRFVAAAIGATVLVALAAITVVVVRHLRTERQAEARAVEEKKGRLVTVRRIERTDAHVSLTLPGEIHGFVESPVYAKIAGYLGRIAVDKGDRVRAGDLLAVIESPELDQSVRNAEASQRLKRLTDERFRTLRAQGIVSQQDADQARADAAQAEAQLRQLQAMAGYERITAEFDGVVTARYADAGTLIPQATGGNLGAGTPIVAMATLDRLRVYVDVPQADAALVRDGDQATVTVSQIPARRFTGTVTRHPQALAAATRTLLVEVDLPNPDGALLPGMYAQVAIELSGRATVPRVPDDVLIFRDGKIWIPLVQGDTLRVVAVTLGYDDGRTSEVTDGLAGDELVALNVGQSARDGETVQVRELPPHP